MPLLNKHFFLGIGTGVALTIFVLISGGVLITKVVLDPAKLQQYIEAPPIPYTMPVDYNWTVQSLDGRYLKLEEVKGKAVFLNFWATWCAPCLAEMPSIQRLYEKTKDKGVVILCVTQEDYETVSRFMSEKGYSFPIYLLRGNPPEVFKSDTIPSTFIFSPDGRVVFKHTGAAKWDDETTVSFLQSLVEQSPLTPTTR
ncbi:MAG: redoxin domain-containing protein [Acidobacteriota bacterium]|nr:redoxin domain-containing protein [Acidobacteriota bacterium]